MKKHMLRGMYWRTIGGIKRVAGRLTANRLLEFEGRHDCLNGRLLLRLARGSVGRVA